MTACLIEESARMSRFAMSAAGIRAALVAVFVAFVAPPLAAEDGHGPRGEEVRKVQSAFLYQFYFYMRGLPSQLSNSAYSIGVLGDDPFGDHLEAVEDLEVEGNPVELHRARDPETLQNCDLIFISDSEKDRLDELLAEFKGKRTVLVSDMRGFAEKGGTVGFVLVEGRVGFEINRSAARESKIEMSSHLLRLAREVWE